MSVAGTKQMTSNARDKLTIEQVNNLDQREFVAYLGGVFESSPWVAEAAWFRRPFGSITELHTAMRDVVQSREATKQEALICAHPDLVGRAALEGTLTPASAREQASAGLDQLRHEEVTKFEELNKAYRSKFGFPFVICVRENKKQAILSDFSTRLTNSREAEVEKALEEIAKIARLRLEELIEQ